MVVRAGARISPVSLSPWPSELRAFDGPGETAGLARATDWSSTGFAAVEDWPAGLRTAASICLSSHLPMVVAWGREMDMLYNDAYVPIIGPDKHPAAFGRPAAEAFGEVWPTIGPMLASVLDTGRATWSEDLPLRLLRHGLLEECAFTFSYSPIHGQAGEIGGIFVTLTETTGRVRATRRLQTLSDLARAEVAVGIQEACDHAAAVLAGNRADIPFAAVYLADDEGREQLAAATGVARGSAAAPAVIDPRSPPWPTAGVVEAVPGAVLVDVEVAEGAGAMVIGLGKDENGGLGRLVLGVSPHQRFEANYRDFLATVASRLGETLALAQSLRRERAGTASLRAEQVLLAEVVARAPAGIVLFWGPEHRLRLVNDRYRELVPAGELVGRPVAEAFPEAATLAVPALDEVLRTGQVLSYENLPLPFAGRQAWAGNRYYTFTLSPIRDAEGTIGGVLGVTVETTAAMRRQRELETELSAERRIAETLQRALLPSDLPRIPDASIAASYQAAGERFQVGGDFYDAFENPDGSWSIVVGDVCGKGPEAAALTSLARHTLRAESGHGSGPGRLLDRLNGDVLRHLAGRPRDGVEFLTVVCARLRRTDAGAEVAFASAGHPPPLVLRRSGDFEEARAIGEVVGLFETAPHEQITVQLAPGDAFVLYTDGITEAWAPARVWSTADIGRALDGCAGLPAEDLVAAIERELPPAEGLRDDYAVVAVSLEG